MCKSMILREGASQQQGRERIYGHTQMKGERVQTHNGRRDERQHRGRIRMRAREREREREREMGECGGAENWDWPAARVETNKTKKKKK